MTKLTDEQIAEHMKALPDWELGSDRIKRTFRFKDFVEAFGWMSSVALIAERMLSFPLRPHPLHLSLSSSFPLTP